MIKRVFVRGKFHLQQWGVRPKDQKGINCTSITESLYIYNNIVELIIESSLIYCE